MDAHRRVGSVLAALARSVLIVEDEPTLRETLAEALTADGLIVVTAADGAEALDRFRELQPDLVLLDLMLPGLPGIEVCRMIKQTQTTRLTPVILITGGADREHHLAGIHAGADDFLFKPFDGEQLRARVRSLARIKRFTDELDSAESVIMSLALTVEARDPYTEGHCERLAKYAVSLGAPESAAIHAWHPSAWCSTALATNGG